MVGFRWVSGAANFIWHWKDDRVKPWWTCGQTMPKPFLFFLLFGWRWYILERCSGNAAWKTADVWTIPSMASRERSNAQLRCGQTCPKHVQHRPASQSLMTLTVYRLNDHSRVGQISSESFLCQAARLPIICVAKKKMCCWCRFSVGKGSNNWFKLSKNVKAAKIHAWKAIPTDWIMLMRGWLDGQLDLYWFIYRSIDASRNSVNMSRWLHPTDSYCMSNRQN